MLPDSLEPSAEPALGFFWTFVRKDIAESRRQHAGGSEQNARAPLTQLLEICVSSV